MFVNIFSIIIFALITSSFASDGAKKSLTKSKTEIEIASEEKGLKRKHDFDSLQERRSKTNDQLEKSGRGCHFGGERYFEGQFMPGVGGPCRACYCLRGQQRCTEEVLCKPPVKGCQPIYQDGACCPVRYDCDSDEKHFKISESDEREFIRSEVNAKLPRKNLLSDLGLKYNFDDEDSSFDIGTVMENHIRIVRESQSEPVIELEDIVTTNPGISDEPSTVLPTTTATAKSTTTIKTTEVVANLKVTDFESTKLVANSPVEEIQNTTKQNDLQVNDPLMEPVRDTSPIEDVYTDIVPDILDTNSSKLEDYALIHSEDETNITGTTDTPPEFYDDYYYDYEELEDTTSVPRLSINEILNKLRTKNEGTIGSLADILPDPITGTNIEEVNTPEEPLNKKEQDNNNRYQDFVSYDVDVGASLIAGTDESDVIGVGQVIPIDLHTEEELPPVISSKPSPESPPTTNTPSTSTSTTNTLPPSTVTTTETTSTSEKTKPQSSFLDTFLSLFRGPESGDEEGKDPSQKLPPLPPPPPFLEKPPPPPPLHNPDIRDENISADVFEAPPPSFFMPPPLPPSENTAPSSILDSGIPEEEFDTEPKTNELDSELDFEAKPTIENEVRARPKPPNGSATRNQLPPIRRRPIISEGSKPFNPGLFASRPKLPLLKPPVEVEEDAPPVELPSNPLVEGGFSAITSADDTTTTSTTTTTTTTTTTSERLDITDGKPTLPPSLPNLQIIPFVAADALVNQGSPAIEEQNGFSPTPFGNGVTQDCREGGKVWKNGETVARGDNDPCVVCRCHLGKVICQRYECAKTPEGCTAEETPPEGECCPKITCDKSANVSIIDTLPSFRPIEEEKVEEPSKPIRPSPFSHHNRRPPFIPGLRRPKPSKPLLPTTKPNLPSAFRTTEEPVAENREIEEAEEKEIPKPGPIRPIRPLSRQPLKPLKPSTTFKPFGNRPRPFSFRNRTGTRPPFVPPRRKNPGILFNTPSFTKSSAEETSPTSSSFTTTESSSTTMVKIPAFIPVSSTPLPEEIKETARPEELDAETFENIFAGLLPKDKDSLPQPIHSDTFDVPQPIPSDTFEIPQPIPSDAFDTPQPIPSDTFEIPQPIIPSDAFDVHQPIPSNTFDEDPQPDKTFILPPEILLPSRSKPLPPTNEITLDDGDITNFVHQDKFRFTTNIRRPEVKFDRKPPVAPIRVQKPNKRLPEIPEVVKAQLPLGNDPILVSGILELAGCNVYGRMFEVGEDIEEISGQCKACQCTKVGVQCLPIC